MVKSTFLMNSRRESVRKLQFRKLRDDTGDSGLLLEGPYSDPGEGVAKLAHCVKKRMRTVSNPIAATLATMAPQNMRGPEVSDLRTPFVVHEAVDMPSVDCAGHIIKCPFVEFEGKQAKAIGIDELTMLATTVLRHLGISSLYSYALYREKGIAVPAILAHDPRPQLLVMIPPFVLDLQTDQGISHIEVLGQDAALAMMKFKKTQSSAKKLMIDIASRSQLYKEEGLHRAMDIGHTLHEAEQLWDLPDAEESRVRIRELLNLGEETALESMRDVAEASTHWLKCIPCHAMKANEEFLCDRAKVLLTKSAMELLLYGPAALAETMASLENHTCLQNLNRYASVPETILAHYHDENQCSVTRDYTPD